MHLYIIFSHFKFGSVERILAATFEPLFTKLKPPTCLSHFRPLAQPKLNVISLVKSLKSQPMSSAKLFKNFKNKMLNFEPEACLLFSGFSLSLFVNSSEVVDGLVTLSMYQTLVLLR